MKKFMTDIKTLAALLMAGAAFTACSSSDDNIIDEQPVNPAQKTYTLTVNAAKGDGATTRALTLDGSTLNATWATTEKVYVKKDAWSESNYLQPQANAATATLTGDLSGMTIAADDVLTLQFPKSGDITYEGQEGTLADIAANFDYATATVEVESVSATGDITPKTATTTFTNQQAIIKFTLKDKANDAAISPSALTVTDGTSTVELTSIPAATYTANGGDNNVLYVAFPAAGSAKTITLTATVGDDTYTYETATAKTFVNGQYYEITVKMTKVPPSVTYTAPTIVSSTLTYNGSGKELVSGGSATGGTIYYRYDYTPYIGSASSSEWSTTVPAPTNAGTYTIYYKVEPNAGYSGGVESTLLGDKIISKANGWVSLTPSSGTGFRSFGNADYAVNVNSHGGSLSYTKSGTNPDNVSVQVQSGNIVRIYKKSISTDGRNTTVTITSAATNNYNAASANFSCNQ